MSVTPNSKYFYLRAVLSFSTILRLLTVNVLCGQIKLQFTVWYFTFNLPVCLALLLKHTAVRYLAANLQHINEVLTAKTLCDWKNRWAGNAGTFQEKKLWKEAGGTFALSASLRNFWSINHRPRVPPTTAVWTRLTRKRAVSVKMGNVRVKHVKSLVCTRISD